MPLVNLQTNLKSLRFGRDRPGLGDSGQPYETTPIPGNNDPIDPNSEDFLLRGGIKGADDTLVDLKRLTKFFDDRKSPDGLLFITKQEMLSRISVRTQASGVGFNEGVYNPLSTLAQAGINIEGGHIPKQGLIPFRGPNTYLNELNRRSDQGALIIGGFEGEGNRLVQLAKIKVDNSLTWKRKDRRRNQISGNNEIGILSYSGGPDSLLGLGKTNILFATNPQGNPLRTGVNNSTSIRIGSKEVSITPNKFYPITADTDLGNISYPLGASNTFNNIPSISGSSNAFSSELTANQTQGYFSTNQTSVYPLSLPGDPSFIQKDDNPMYNNGSRTMNQEQLYSQFPNKPNKFNPGSEIQDFRKDLIKNKKSSTIMSLAPTYSDPKKTIDGPRGSRINYTSPGQKGNIISYTAGKLDPNDPKKKIGPVDRINALPIYRSSHVIFDKIKNDIIKFRIATIDTENPHKKEFIHFRAFIDSFSDTYNGSWNPQKYMGRGEPFYKYDSFVRDINLSFTVAAQSREEIMIMYKKLNYLASNLAPDYTKAGYMAGPLVQLTLGGWCYELPGFIKSMTLDVPQESPWEIAIPSSDKEVKDFGGIKIRDTDMKEMPMICKVSGFNFTPIHTFRPAKQKNTFTSPSDGSDKDLNNSTITQYGPERFIQLDDGGKNNNYDQQPRNPISGLKSKKDK
ncbi:MAG: hypothetical protein CMC82_03510 [Flavobacteriaceae bacterium]|nr:hypothetical protein [Flavobacteriaceae bacterium]|tara:strand:+ start:1107 stop:3152 length:2046 start_codon:yes stop_codon:yes gene_type:complete